jgi:hypothetical protein
MSRCGFLQTLRYHMRRRIHVMSYEEEDTCHIRTHTYLAHSHMRRRIHVISYEEEDTCHMRRRIHVI